MGRIGLDWIGFDCDPSLTLWLNFTDANTSCEGLLHIVRGTHSLTLQPSLCNAAAQSVKSVNDTVIA